MPITHLSTGAPTDGFASFSPDSGFDDSLMQVGDLLLCLIAGKPYNAAVTSVASNGVTYTRIGDTRFTDGTVAAGTDAGSMFVEAWYALLTPENIGTQD